MIQIRYSFRFNNTSVILTTCTKHIYCEMKLNKIHARIQKVLSEGSNFDNVQFFLFYFS